VAIRDAVEHHGYEVQGLAPTSRAAQKLAEAGMKNGDVATASDAGSTGGEWACSVYIVDEASMVSTRQMHAFMERLGRHDRCCSWAMCGNTRRRSGRPYAQMQERDCGRRISTRSCAERSRAETDG